MNAREPQTELGRRIRRRRVELELTQGDLALRVGMLQPVISQWELGDSRPKGIKLECLAAALEVTPEWLLEKEG